MERRKIEFQERYGALRGIQNGMTFWIRKDELQSKGEEQRYFVVIYTARNEPRQVSTGGRQNFHLDEAKEFCQQIAAGEITLEALRARYEAEDAAKEREAIRKAAERARKFKAELGRAGLSCFDFRVLNALWADLGERGQEILAAYERGEGWPDA